MIDLLLGTTNLLDRAEEFPESDFGLVFDRDFRAVISKPNHKPSSPFEEPPDGNRVDSNGRVGSGDGLDRLAPHSPDVNLLDNPVVTHVQRVVLSNLEPSQTSPVNRRKEILHAGWKIFQGLILQFFGRFPGCIIGKVTPPMFLLIEGQHDVPMPFAFPGDFGESIRAEFLGCNQRLKMILHRDTRESGQNSGRDGIGRNPEGGSTLAIGSLLKFEGHLPGANGWEKE